MSFPNDNLKQYAIYWGSPVGDGQGGYTYADAVEIACRWENSSRLLRAADGSQLVARAEVQVSQDLDDEGMLKLGRLNDLDSDETDDPVEAGAWQIVRFDKVPTLDGLSYYRKAWL